MIVTILGPIHTHHQTFRHVSKLLLFVFVNKNKEASIVNLNNYFYYLPRETDTMFTRN